MNWRMIIEDVAPGPELMARDIAILRQIEKGESPPTLRVYGWDPLCITLGHSQKVEREIELERVVADGIGLARRFTGGRAVFHAQELTYSVLAPLDVGQWASTLADAYAVIGAALAETLNATGQEIELERGESSEGFHKTGASRPCFASTSKSELVFRGRKLAGSAQRRTSKAFLQHGSILTGPMHLRVVDYLKLSEAERIAFLAQLQQHSSDLSQSSWVPTREEFKNRLSETWAKFMDCPVEWSEMTPIEQEISLSLVDSLDLKNV